MRPLTRPVSKWRSPPASPTTSSEGTSSPSSLGRVSSFFVSSDMFVAYHSIERRGRQQEKRIGEERGEREKEEEGNDARMGRERETGERCHRRRIGKPYSNFTEEATADYWKEARPQMKPPFSIQSFPVQFHAPIQPFSFSSFLFRGRCRHQSKDRAGRT